MPSQLVIKAPTGERLITLDARAVVGRDEACEIAIDSPRLSRRHAEFIPTTEGVIVRDLESTNGVVLNGRLVHQALLRGADRVTLGDVSIMLHQPSAMMPQPSDVDEAPPGDDGAAQPGAPGMGDESATPDAVPSAAHPVAAALAPTRLVSVAPAAPAEGHDGPPPLPPAVARDPMAAISPVPSPPPLPPSAGAPATIDLSTSRIGGPSMVPTVPPPVSRTSAGRTSGGSGMSWGVWVVSICGGVMAALCGSLIQLSLTSGFSGLAPLRLVSGFVVSAVVGAAWGLLVGFVQWRLALMQRRARSRLSGE
jgi:hypothetical protein